MKNKYNQFNVQDSILVLTSLPQTGTTSLLSRGFNAVGWHATRIISLLSQTHPLVIFSEYTNKPSRENKRRMIIDRAWKKGDIFSLFQVGKKMLSLKKVKRILVQFEFNVFGGIIPNVAVLFMLIGMRLMGKHVVFELHQVITDIKKLVKHVHITSPTLQFTLNICLKGFYVLLGFSADKVIVFEEELARKLSHYVPASKIERVYLPVVSETPYEKSKARRQVNEEARKRNLSAKPLSSDDLVVLLFGFINGYKGFDVVIPQIAKLNKNRKKNIRLLIVGGENPYLKDDPHYQAFYQKVLSQIRDVKESIYMGFVPDDEIKLYFSAADVLLLPYEVFMSGSGPFSHTLSFSTPVLLSEHLAPYLRSADMHEALIEQNLQPKDLVFPLTQKGLEAKLERIESEAGYLSRLQGFVGTLGQLRSLENFTMEYIRILTPRASKLKLFFLNTKVAYNK